ncbi:unnamed protein product [Brassicogethes aeneus]|uniref:NADPH-dependent diflavin oxidoreductase 1 n=1 Tax=Brassicogethes aeneus TaxID=1431903 RepID=A0A9P0B1L8_BRAAE|nr:unnamed protein product [Brassicogethes aeneus]
MTFQNVKITVLYGSQTGNSQDVAERIWRECKRFYFSCSVKSMDEYDVLELINETCVVFVCATTGQGEEPDNMKSFWRFLLRKSLPHDSLSGIRYGVLGLGDSSYAKYNFVAKRLHKRILQLGGNPILPLGLGDDQHDLGYDATVDPWIEQLWEKLLISYPLPKDLKPLDKNLAILPRWKVSSKLLDNNFYVNKTQSIYYSTRKTTDFNLTVLENSRLTSGDHFQDVRLLKFQTTGQKYIPGDLVVLRPKNFPWKIEEFRNVLESNGVKIPPKTVFNLSQNDPDMPLPEVLKYEVTFQQLCEEYWDLMAIPRRHVFNILAQITDSELEREKCIEFTTAEGQNDLYSYTNRPRRNIVEVLSDFPHATKNLTKELLFEILPPIKPREFSIASSCKAHKNEIHVLLAIVRYKTKLMKERLGLCSNYLSNLTSGDSITAWLKGGSFKFPQKQDVPVILVGPGTGVAPFRNYILEKVNDNVVTPENMILIFGCRNKNKDFLCKNDFEKLDNEKKITLICAFSRDQDHKIYVQHQILNNSEKIFKALTSGGYVFVAGNAKQMPQSVRQAFVDVLVKHGMSDDEATKFIETMEKTNRYQTECWS